MKDPSAAPDPPLGFPDPPRDRFEFWVRFFFGALFGSLLSTLLWLRYFYWIDTTWLAIPIVGVLCAFAAARFGDNFWIPLRGLRWLRWW
jgi:hypothetical protein